MAFSPTQSIPTLAQVLAAGSDAGGGTIANLSGLNAITFTNSLKTMNFPSDGALWMHGATIAMNVSDDPGTGGGAIVMEGGIVYGIGGMIADATFPVVQGATGVVWNNSEVLTVSP